MQCIISKAYVYYNESYIVINTIIYNIIKNHMFYIESTEESDQQLKLTILTANDHV